MIPGFFQNFDVPDNKDVLLGNQLSICRNFNSYGDVLTLELCSHGLIHERAFCKRNIGIIIPIDISVDI